MFIKNTNCLAENVYVILHLRHCLEEKRLNIAHVDTTLSSWTCSSKIPNCLAENPKIADDFQPPLPRSATTLHFSTAQHDGRGVLPEEGPQHSHVTRGRGWPSKRHMLTTPDSINGLVYQRIALRIFKGNMYRKTCLFFPSTIRVCSS